MRNVFPDLSVNIAPVLPALNTHLPSGPTVTECSEWSWLTPWKPVSSTSRLSTAGSNRRFRSTSV